LSHSTSPSMFTSVFSSALSARSAWAPCKLAANENERHDLEV
jgi:hypothetical protein